MTSELTLDTDASPDGFTYSSVVIAAGATLKATGKNPLIINVESSIDIQGTIDLSGGKGGNSPGSHKAAGGGAGGGALKISAPTITIGPDGAIHVDGGDGGDGGTDGGGGGKGGDDGGCGSDGGDGGDGGGEGLALRQMT